ncbi:hypothetical protein GE061_000035 [Apolygus lucorum]|uniref:Uncharacterized protein n=1 Tax=Apolygus lucorum TaxID=248454 RepID=A0A8S9Y4E9_APOLU|nr:hypothetical protein GE061_000035 [Apolygus lucorum]
MEERTKKIVAAAGGMYALSVLVSRKKDRKKWEKEWISRRNAHSHMGLVKELQAEEREDYKYSTKRNWTVSKVQALEMKVGISGRDSPCRILDFLSAKE